MNLLDPDSSVARRHTRRRIAQDIYVSYVRGKPLSPISGSREEYENAARASFELADIFLDEQEKQPPVFDEDNKSRETVSD